MPPIKWSVVQKFLNNALKTNWDNIYINWQKFVTKTFQEFWKPKDKDLDVLKVVRRIPQIFILLSKDSLDPNESGFQYKDINIFNQLIDKNELNSNSNKLKQNKSKPKNRQKNNRKSGNESNNNKKMETQS